MSDFKVDLVFFILFYVCYDFIFCVQYCVVHCLLDVVWSLVLSQCLFDLYLHIKYYNLGINVTYTDTLVFR